MDQPLFHASYWIICKGDYIAKMKLHRLSLKKWIWCDFPLECMNINSYPPSNHLFGWSYLPISSVTMFPLHPIFCWCSFQGCGFWGCGTVFSRGGFHGRYPCVIITVYVRPTVIPLIVVIIVFIIILQGFLFWGPFTGAWDEVCGFLWFLEEGLQNNI